VVATDNALLHLQAPPATVPMLARAALASLPVGSRLIRGGRDQTHATLALDDIAIDRDRLARYVRVCGFDLSDALPATYPHVLAFGLQLALLTDPGLPLPAVGLVHIGNRIEQRRPIDAAERLSLRVGLEPITPHPRGRSVTLRTEVVCAGESVWAEWSTMLHRGDGDGDASVPAAPSPPSAAELARSAEWRLPGDLGRRYAAVSGDRNPIHLHALTARPLGFRRPIVHGMWTLARCLAALGPELPAAFAAEVAFKRPILLPAKVAFAEDAGTLAFGVRDARDETPHLDGLISAPAEAQSESAAAS
jgi:hypothetical protein